MNSPLKTGRLDVVDALRGFAIVCILLLHNLEHFDFAFFPEQLPDFIKVIDQNIWDFMFFFIGGKAYSIFSLLFGLTFFIQDSHQIVKGYDFRARFAWRLVLLFLFSMFNSIFFQGDILIFFAVLGLLVIPVARLKDGVVLAVATIFLLQPFELGSLVCMLSDPSYVQPTADANYYFGLTKEYFMGSSLLQMVKSDMIYGRIAVILWNWNNGRIFQIPALIMLGMLLGRRGMFEETEKSKRFWTNTLIISSFVAVGFMSLRNQTLFEREDVGTLVNRLLVIWSNLAMTAMVIAGFFLIYTNANKLKSTINKIFIPFGKMSLSCYIISSVYGFFIYYGCGLAMYKYTGALYSLIIGIIVLALQRAFNVWYLKSHKRGPLEELWHKGTWLFSKKK